MKTTHFAMLFAALVAVALGGAMVRHASPDAPTLTIGVAGATQRMEPVRDHLARVLDHDWRVRLAGNVPRDFAAAEARMKTLEWDVAIAPTPLVALAAQDAGYHFAMRVAPGQAAERHPVWFALADSPLRDVSDLKPDATVAVGSPEEAETFQVPLYELYGRTVRVDSGESPARIRERVLSGLAAAGVCDAEALAGDSRLKVLRHCRSVPAPGVYLSPKLDEMQRTAIAHVLEALPEETLAGAGLAAGSEPPYTEFRLVMRTMSEILATADLHATTLTLR